MSLGALVVAIAILFVIGNVMGLKPKAGEVRIGEMRLLARKLALNPKLVAMPDWIMDVRQNKGLGKNGMIAQYTLINDDWRLPAQRFLWSEDVWRHMEDNTVLASVKNAIPPHLCAHMKALTIKANSVSLYWYDEPYVKGFAIRDRDAMTKMTRDLDGLKAFLTELGDYYSSS